MTETIQGGRDLLGFYADDGYSFMEGAGRLGWQPIASWGRDGWDLGDWPLVVYLFRNRDRYERVCYIEGDVTIDRFDTAEERDRDTDAAALHWWQVNGESWVAGIDTADQMPDHLRGRFSWARLEETGG
jgi:hypothetical protein